jgi:hypothetical protein
MDDPFDLKRFEAAQDRGGTYATAVSELRAGRKLSHWMFAHAAPEEPLFGRWGNFILMASPPRPGEAHTWMEKFGSAFPNAEHG